MGAWCIYVWLMTGKSQSGVFIRVSPLVYSYSFGRFCQVFFPCSRPLPVGLPAAPIDEGHVIPNLWVSFGSLCRVKAELWIVNTHTNKKTANPSNSPPASQQEAMARLRSNHNFALRRPQRAGDCWCSF